MARNRYPGTCYCCGNWVPTGFGHFERHNGSWRIKCVKCASGSSKCQCKEVKRAIKLRDEELKRKRGGRDEIKCPICNYELKLCQCLFAGNWHPDRTKIREVVLDHLYLLTDEQIKHIQYLEKYWNTSYIDEEKEEIKRKLKDGGRDEE